MALNISTSDITNYLPLYFTDKLLKTNSKITTSSTTFEDVSAISEMGKQISKLPFIIGGSNAVLSKDGIKFDLAYSDNEVLDLHANGFYSLKEKKLETNFSFIYSKDVTEDGITKTKKYQVNFGFNFKTGSELSVQKSESKEDIIKFMKRIVSRVMDIGGDKNKKLTGIVFEDEDLKDLMSIDDSSKPGQSLKELIYMILTLALFKELMTKKKDAEEILLTPKREKEETTQIKLNENEDLEMTLSIQEIIEENTEEALEVTQIENKEVTVNDTVQNTTQQETVTNDIIGAAPQELVG
ncbi:MAG: hypothetical protein V1773_00950 [bacterium]